MNPTEVELKLLLPGADAKTIEQTLANLQALAGRAPRRQWLWNRYYDTAAQSLRHQRSALRLRCVSTQAWPEADPAHPPAGKWIQTFKTAGSSQGGLSRRGEWESHVVSGELDRAALLPTPWSDFDPEGELFAQLRPCFDTRCRRTTWLLEQDDGSRIEVALDVGEIAAAGESLPMLELELELQAGNPDTIFKLARTIAEQVAVLPCDASKAERGYALAQGILHAPAGASPVHLSVDATPLTAALQAMGGILEQFTRNLTGLLHADDPELVHQARVAWRRWRSCERLFRPWLSTLQPAHAPLRPLLDALGRLRDLDVACSETLPAWTGRYVDGDAQRHERAEQALRRLQQTGERQRGQVRSLLAQPGTGLGLLALAQWLHERDQEAQQDRLNRKVERDWARERSARLLRRLRQAVETGSAEGATEPQQHRARLLAKRTRYGVETLHDLLPGKKAVRWVREASQVQASLGAERDLLRAIALLQEDGATGGLIDFLRGVAAANQHGQIHPG